jgi:YD repeat-containing protein
MAVRNPLYEVSGNLREMSTAMVDSIVDQVVYQYSLNPSVALSVVSSGGNLGTITDTRKQAGAHSTSATAFPSEATTAEPGTVTVSYSKVDQSNATVTPTTDTGKTWPVYYNASGQIQAMNLQDVKDTFLHPAIDLLTAATTTSDQAGTYHISSSSSVTGSTLISATPVFSDTRADTSLYTAGSIPETLDQPTTITNYYLHRVNGSAPSFTLPYYINASNNVQQFASATFNSLVQEWIRYTAASSADGYSISYNLGTSGSGNTRGSGMGDTILNGSGDYQTRFVNIDDYRAQEFPNGTAVTANTYYLRINKS